MSPEAYTAAWGAVARVAAAPIARSFGLSRGIPDTLPTFANAVYVACDRAGAVVYVGSSIRTVRTRVGEHARDRHRGATWDSLWVIPLQDGLARSRVRIAEGRVGRLLQPRESIRLPRC